MRIKSPGLLVICIAIMPLMFGTAYASEDPLPAGRDFGAGLTLEKMTALSQVVASPERFVENPVLVRGHLTDLCMKKGCWTVMTDGDAVVRVRFQDYGFFLPEDALGANAIIEGRAEIRTLSEREARHIALEARDGDPNSIHGPQRGLGFVATGVRILQSPIPSPSQPAAQH